MSSLLVVLFTRLLAGPDHTWLSSGDYVPIFGNRIPKNPYARQGSAILAQGGGEAFDMTSQRLGVEDWTRVGSNLLELVIPPHTS